MRHHLSLQHTPSAPLADQHAGNHLAATPSSDDAGARSLAETALRSAPTPRRRRFEIACRSCGRRVIGTSRRRYCSDECRQFAYYWRQQGRVTPPALTDRILARRQARPVHSVHGLAPTPNVGVRVSVQLPTDRACHDNPHLPDEHDQTGTIVRVEHPADALPSGLATHRCLIIFDQPVVSWSHTGPALLLTARHYAEDEFTVLSDG